MHAGEVLSGAFPIAFCKTLSAQGDTLSQELREGGGGLVSPVFITRSSWEPGADVREAGAVLQPFSLGKVNMGACTRQESGCKRGRNRHVRAVAPPHTPWACNVYGGHTHGGNPNACALY